MALPMRPNNSRGGSVSRNRRVKGDCTFRCSGCLPTHLGWISSKSGGVGCSANICSLITFPARMPSKPLSERISPITIKRPSRSTGPTPSRSLNRKSVRIYDSVYLVYEFSKNAERPIYGKRAAETYLQAVEIEPADEESYNLFNVQNYV